MKKLDEKELTKINGGALSNKIGCGNGDGYIFNPKNHGSIHSKRY
ncbi:bacteriocin [Clostridium botulinum]|nr:MULTISPECIES: bacteriocin [Clostridium]MCS6131093.1 bacteriocin [Clostridium botulinum]NFL45359.1 bacteriocin [Clostridium botulinum]NFL90423.1 bacteriocin [Clostridium botulinum]